MIRVLPFLSEFFERTILCNSLVWSCALTGRAGLTYLEAVESERRAKQSLQNFPQCLVVPLLHLAALSRRCRLTELCEDVYAFVKDRFFPGETVDVTGRNGARYWGEETISLRCGLKEKGRTKRGASTVCWSVLGLPLREPQSQRFCCSASLSSLTVFASVSDDDDDVRTSEQASVSGLI